MSARYNDGLPSFIFEKCSACMKKNPKLWAAHFVTKIPATEPLTESTEWHIRGFVWEYMNEVRQMPRARRRRPRMSATRLEGEPYVDLDAARKEIDRRIAVCWSGHVSEHLPGVFVIDEMVAGRLASDAEGEA